MPLHLRKTHRRRVPALAVAMVLLLATPLAVIGWETTSDVDEAGATAKTTARQRNQVGDAVEVFKDVNDFVYVRLTLAPGFTSFALTSCTTFQIDSRKPVHHYDVGNDCRVAEKSLTIFLGDIVDGLIVSLPLYRFMNGNRVAFRYITNSGEYRESVFSLRGSKAVLTAALGGVAVEPKLASSEQ